MKKTKFKKSLWKIVLSGIVFGLMVLFSPLTAFSSQGDVMDKVKKAKSKVDLAGQLDKSIDLPKNIVRVSVPYQGGKFYTLARKHEIKRFECSSCHNNKSVSIRNAAAISHADITINHGDIDKPLTCDTCHNKEDRDFLKKNETDKIDMDHVYNMCGQCHFRQKKDWVGGAHGKRVTYWAGERVVENCTFCHNPHSPRFAKRWPSTYSVPLK